MPIHDTWHFENAPQGVNMCTAAFGVAYTNTGIYNQYTGNSGMLVYNNTNSPWTVDANGFLNNTATSGYTGAIQVPLNVVQDWSVATQYWFGFRTKLVANFAAAPILLAQSNNVAYGGYTVMLTEAQLTAAGYNTLAAEHYIEVFMDRTALVYQVYVDGALLTSGALSSSYLGAGAGILSFGSIAGAVGTQQRAYRDFYFLDVDAVKTPNRLGPVRAKATVITAATASEYTPQGAASLLAALTTSFGSAAPTNTPNVLSSTDGQALVQQLSTSFSDSQYQILGVQPIASFASNTQAPPTLVASFTDSNGGNVAGGLFAQGGAGPFYNQKLPLVQTGPNGAKWTAAEINQSQYVLTPQ